MKRMTQLLASRAWPALLLSAATRLSPTGITAEAADAARPSPNAGISTAQNGSAKEELEV